ncbi:hypothetical protein AB1N83_004200 [Pleurotus pulmonarius]
MTNHGMNPIAPPQANFPVAMTAFCPNCGGDFSTDACGHRSHPIYSSIHIYGNTNISTTAPIYQSFGSSTNQGSTQYGVPAMGPDMWNATHTQGHPYSGNDQHGLQMDTAYIPAFTNPPGEPKLTMRPVGSPAICAAAEKRRKTEAKFRCIFADCDKSFTAKHNLESHEKAHYNIRPFVCRCGSAFTAKADLKRHWKSQKHRDETNQMYSSPIEENLPKT